MKCPKCGYLGFEPVDRCRNCGYDFSFTETAATPELPLRTPDSRIEAPQDLSLDHSYPDRSELPLFSIGADDEPLITKPSPPRAPLAVRRATPDLPRVRHEAPRMASLDLTLDPGPHSRLGAEAAGLEPADAGIGPRIIAVIIDLLILAAVDAIVVYFTMRMVDISLDEIAILPKGPLLAFLFVQNVGYLVAFTAGGQTLGKMAAGIRVVAADEDSTLDLGRAFVRTAMWLLLAVPAGLGFVTALFSRDRRGLHDRFAGTRVVR